MQANNFLRTLSLLHYSLCGGLLFFSAFAYWQNGGFNASYQDGDIFIYIIPIVAAAGYFGSKYMFQNLLQNIPKEEPLQTKLARYQSASLIKYALIEVPAIIALFAYFWNGTALHFAVAITLMIYLFAQRPTKEKILLELQIDFEEKKQFDTLRS
jgi:hypothetical protein